MSNKVILHRCEKYDVELIKRVLRKGFEEIGGLNRFVHRGQRVFLKLNLLMRKRPEDGVTTHPAVVEAVTLLLQEQGAQVVIGDSPGGPYKKALLKSIYKAAGIEEVANKTGAELNYNTEIVEVPHPAGKIVKRFTIIKPLLDADVYLSLSKLKTHMMTRFTGAVKVNFGTIPGLVKAEYHFKMPDVMDFSNMLLDLTDCVKPKLNIMDAIIGMEGKGPSAGDLREVGALLISEKATALDVVATALVGIEPESVPTIKAAGERGWPSTLEDIQVLGEPLDSFNIKPFKTPAHTEKARFPVPDLLNKALEAWLRPKPVFCVDKCVLCQECIKCCPAQALTIGDEKPQLDKKKCISCFCCQELCPKMAVDVKRSPLSKMLFK